MTWSLTVLAMTTLALVAVGVGVVVAVIIRYRPSIRMMPMKEWFSFLFPAPQSADDKAEGEADQVVTPRTVSLRQFMNDTAVEGNAYVDAQRLPGYEHLEQLDQAAKQWESRVEQSGYLKTRQKVSH